MNRNRSRSQSRSRLNTFVNHDRERIDLDQEDERIRLAYLNNPYRIARDGDIKVSGKPREIKEEWDRLAKEKENPS